MNPRIQKILAVAFHPGTGEAEAINAFLKARALGVREVVPAEHGGDEGTVEHRFVYAPIGARFYRAFVNAIDDLAQKQKLVIRLRWTDEGLDPRDRMSTFVTAMEILAKGSPDQVAAFKRGMQDVLDWADDEARRAAAKREARMKRTTGEPAPAEPPRS